MYNVFNNQNLSTFICYYLEPDDIIQFAECYKPLKKALNPETNIDLNIMFMFGVTRKFFLYDRDDLTNNIFFRKKNLLAIIKFKKNWRNVYEQLKINLDNYIDKEIVKKVKDIFRIHMFLPDLRKENQHLEFESSSIHQIFSYDVNFRNFCTYNFYSKYITKDFMDLVLGDISGANEGNNIIKEIKEIKILREKLYFEQQLKNFNSTFNDFINNEECINIIMNVVNYKYEYIDNLYIYKYNQYLDKFGEKGSYKIILVLIYLTHSLIQYTNYYHDYMNSFIDNADEKSIFIEFCRIHNDITSAALLLNSNFENINIILNEFIIYFSVYIDTKDNNKTELCLSKNSSESSTKSSESSNSNDFNFNNKEKFSLYKYLSKIIKKNVYDKLSPLLNPKLQKLIESFVKDLFENFETKYNKNIKNDRDYDMDYDDDDDNMIIEEGNNDQEDESIENEFVEKEPSEKETVEHIINLFVDFAINGKNANGINHTELKVPDEYIQFENSLINIFENGLIKYINEGRSNSYLFDVIETITKINTNRCNFLRSSSSLSLIRRTKKRLMENLFKILFKNVFQCLINSYKSHVKINENNILSISLSNTELLNNNEYNCDLSDLSSKKKIKVTSAVNDEIKAIKEKIFAECISSLSIQYPHNEIEKLVNDFINSNGIEEVSLIKKMVWFYYRELGLYEEKNEKIIKILKCSNSNVNENCDSNIILLNGKSI